MVISMTGYGRASGTLKNKSITVEIRSLNGRNTDLRMRIPNNYKEKEIDLRKIVLDKAIRGKMDVTISFESAQSGDEYGLNFELFRKYFEELNKFQKELGYEGGDLVQAVMRIPNVIQISEKSISEEEWKFVLKLTHTALDALMKFRKNEGNALKDDLTKRTKIILQLLKKVRPFEKQRIQFLKEKMRKNLKEYLGDENVDVNRFEQEVLHYLEKLDINEEKVRLRQHCEFFQEEIKANDTFAKGKKMSFIGQEMGREINTLGAKAQYSEIQKIVVQMKDELEKIKEQVANIV